MGLKNVKHTYCYQVDDVGDNNRNWRYSSVIYTSQADAWSAMGRMADGFILSQHMMSSEPFEVLYEIDPSAEPYEGGRILVSIYRQEDGKRYLADTKVLYLRVRHLMVDPEFIKQFIN